MGGSVPREVLESAAEPVLERIREDQQRLPAPPREFVAYVGRHLLAPELSVRQGLASARMSSNSARDRFRFAVDLSPTDYVLECRMELAFRLLQRLPDVSIARIADAIGYQENTFHAAFRRFFKATAHQTRLRMWAVPELLELEPALLRREVLLRANKGRLGNAEQAAVRRTFRALGTRPWGAMAAPADEGEEAFGERFFDGVMRERLARASRAEQVEIVRGGFPFESIALPRALLRWSREGSRGDRRLGAHLAEMAVDGVWALRAELGPAELANLLAETYAHLGDARRLLFDDPGAEAAFANAELELSKHPAPAGVQADFLRLKGRWRRSQRRLQEALELLTLALAKAAGTGPRARALLDRAAVHELQGNEALAEADYVEAQRQLEAGGEAELRIAAHSCLGIFHARCGDHLRAEVELCKARELAPAAESPSTDPHLLWVEGLCRHAREQWSLAERCLREAREGFAALGEPLCAALAGLDLARLLCRSGPGAEVEPLIAEALPLLERIPLDGEGRTALLGLRRPAPRREITVARLKHLRARLELAELAPRWP